MNVDTAPFLVFLLVDLNAIETDVPPVIHATLKQYTDDLFVAEGDLYTAVFQDSSAAIEAALALQRAWYRALPPELYPNGLRIALHTGHTGVANGIYFGATLNRTRQLLHASLPGQIVLSLRLYDLVADQLPPNAILHETDPGRLRDLLQAESFFLLTAPDLPAPPRKLRTLETYLANLPIQPTPFLGREAEITALTSKLRRGEQRMVTLIAPSGTGKTRFALEVATQLLDDFADGVFFISLAPIYDIDLVMPTIAHTLGLKDTPHLSALEQLQAYLASRRVLLLLDNFEQIVDSAPAIEALLAATHRLAILVTSHVPLQIAGETVVIVPPLDVPDPQALPPLDQLVCCTAIALFIERLQAVAPNFVLDEVSGKIVTQLCGLVGGIPLAIELVAAYGDVLTLQEIFIQLDRARTSSTLSLQQVLDWSFARLGQAGQLLFARLGVFVEGCTLEGAEAVCNLEGDPPLDVLNEVALLLRRNLLLDEQLAGGDPRYIMLDCIHDDALRRLAARGEQEIVEQQHTDYYVNMANTLTETFQNDQQTDWVQLIAGEQNNLRTVLMRALERGDGTTAVRICAGIWMFWMIRGMVHEGQRSIEAALALCEEPPHEIQAWLYNGAGWFAHMMGNGERAFWYYERSLALYRMTNNRTSEAGLIYNMALQHLSDGNREQAHACLTASLEIQRTFPEPSSLCALTNNILAILAAEKGDLDTAEHHSEESLAIARVSADQRMLVNSLAYLAEIKILLGKQDEAWPLLAEGLRASQEMRGSEMQSLLLFSSARIAAAQAQPLHAARLLGAAEALNPDAPRSAADNDAEQSDAQSDGGYQQFVAQVRTQCEPEAFAHAWTEGRSMTLDQAITLALSVIKDPWLST